MNNPGVYLGRVDGELLFSFGCTAGSTPSATAAAGAVFAPSAPFGGSTGLGMIESCNFFKLFLCFLPLSCRLKLTEE
jgi:hypothetical protein